MNGLRVAIALVAGLVIGCVAVEAQLAGPAAPGPRVEFLKDFVECFDEATVTNCPHANVNRLARTGNVLIPSIGLHPTGEGDSIVAFPRVPIPEAADGSRPLLLFRIGMSDGIPWDHELKPNGVRFSVAVEGEVRFEEVADEGGWRLRVLDLSEWAGTEATIEFRSNAIDGNQAYDWALVGRPVLARFTGTEEYLVLPEDTVGLALVQLACATDARVSVAMGDAVERATLKQGNHVLPLEFRSVEELTLTVEVGEAEVVRVEAAPAPYRIEVGALMGDTPLVIAGRPFSVLLELKNTGTGLYPGGGEVALNAEPGDVGELTGQGGATALVGKLAPGSEGVCRWDNLSAPGPGEWTLTASLGDQVRSVSFRVHPPAPQLPRYRPDGGWVSVRESGAIRAIAANPWSRLCFVGDDMSGGYAVTETWNGTAWQRTGSLYPLARVVAETADGEREELALSLDRFQADAGALIISGRAVSQDGTAWPVRIECRPSGDAPRLQLEYALSAPKGGKLLAFSGPTVLAGDKAYGARKDFAIFPGLEYLEGAEESSSPRDLAPPLNDRQVPFAYKIATPLMAVQGGGSLTALLWDASQEWAPGERLPAARFLAPKLGIGPESVHLSLFAPSVGEYVEENRDEATTPYALEPGEEVRLSGSLVLDHESRYGAESVVKGPHKGGLVLQAMQHWFDCYGMPEPSPQPRSWDDQRALSREAYLKTLWSEDPAGWPSHIGAPLEPNVPLTAPILLDLMAGVSAVDEAALRDRIDRVVARSLAETKTLAPVHGNWVLLQLQYGNVAEALARYEGMARGTMGGRENGLWVWRPGDAEHAALGIPGTHTLGQATYPSLIALRAARHTGDPGLITEALEASRQMGLYDVPRGASMWECPQYQPDILAAALAVKAYCEAYRLTGDDRYLDHARYWAWTGLPFLYTWQLDGYPTMLYNSIGVIGSTYFTHSWIGRPVVWMGLDYALALQDLAEFDDSFPWLKIAQGITNSAMWQQYADGPSKGCYPDSWEMAKNTPNPVDINPLLIMNNEFRLRGMSLETRGVRLDGVEPPIFVNAGTDIEVTDDGIADGRLAYTLRGVAGFPAHVVIAPVALPAQVEGAGTRVTSSDELATVEDGWMYDEGLEAVIVKHSMRETRATGSVRWDAR